MGEVVRLIVLYLYSMLRAICGGSCGVYCLPVYIRVTGRGSGEACLMLVYDR